MAEIPSGNPVFDFKSGFRARAKGVQKFLALAGLIAILAGIIVGLFAPHLACNVCIISSGALSLGAGVLWGFFWRSHLRSRFRKEYS